MNCNALRLFRQDLPLRQAFATFLVCRKKLLDYCGESSYFPVSPKSHVPMGVRRTLELVRKFGKVPGINPSSRYSGQPENARTPEATTVRAFLFSPCFPSAGVTEEAHLHCRTCGWDTPSNPWQTKPDPCRFRGVDSSFALSERLRGSGVSTGWIRVSYRLPFVLRSPGASTLKREST